MTYPVVILAGGKGTRVSSITNDEYPKCMIPINGKPFLDYKLDWLKAEGVTRTIILCGPWMAQIKDRYGDRALCLGDDGLGTDEAIHAVLDRLPEIFWVMYGDSYIDCDLTNLEWLFHHRKAISLKTIWYGMDYGASLFRRDRFNSIDGPLYVGIDEPFHEIGSPEGIKETEEYFAKSGIS